MPNDRELLAHLTTAATFLCDRLDELDLANLADVQRDFCGHVVPAVARLRMAIGGEGQIAGGEVERALVEPWADHNGPLPDFDHPVACVFDSGVQYAVELLAKELGVTDWAPCDGTEEYDGDLGGTLMNVVLAAMPKDKHGDPIWPRDLPPSLRPDATSAIEMREMAARVAETYHDEMQCSDGELWIIGQIAAAIRALQMPAADEGVTRHE